MGAPQPIQRICRGISIRTAGAGGGPSKSRAKGLVRYLARILGIARKKATITTPAAINGHWALTTLLWMGGVQAQSWPSRHITMVVPFAAGSASDAVGRVVAAHMTEALGQQVVIENVGGASDGKVTIPIFIPIMR